VIQAFLGHDKLETTARYTRVATGMIAKIESPLDGLSARHRRRARRDTEEGPPAMARPTLEFADILRDHGPAWREANCGKVMSAIERHRNRRGNSALDFRITRKADTELSHYFRQRLLQPRPSPSP
jgi:hypothetical protein